MPKKISTGRLELTKPEKFKFISDSASFLEIGEDLRLDVSHYIPEERVTMNIGLVVKAEKGASHGDFKDNAEVPYSFFLHRIEGDLGFAYFSESGTYNINYDPDANALSGTVAFTAKLDENTRYDFAYTFNIPSTK